MLHAGNRETRRLFAESLESRRLMAVDCTLRHNFANPEDTDASGIVSPIDALKVINVLNAQVDQSIDQVDVNADGVLSAIDVLTVINTLNQQAASGEKVESGVPVAARIARIEAALADGLLPPNLSLERATEILTTLRLGGAPELGDRLEAHKEAIQDKLNALADRLEQLEVDTSKIETVITDIRAKVEQGASNLRTIVDTVLDENGLDLEELKTALKQNERLANLTQRLEELGINGEFVDRIAAKIQTLLDTDLSQGREQLATWLRRLGVDPLAVIGDIRQTLQTPVSADRVTDQLEKLGVDATVIAIVVGKIEAAEELGTPMTRKQLFALLVDLAVTRDGTELPRRPRLGRLRG
jgi:hypothetical protein